MYVRPCRQTGAGPEFGRMRKFVLKREQYLRSRFIFKGVIDFVHGIIRQLNDNYRSSQLASPKLLIHRLKTFARENIIFGVLRENVRRRNSSSSGIHFVIHDLGGAFLLYITYKLNSALTRLIRYVTAVGTLLSPDLYIARYG